MTLRARFGAVGAAVLVLIASCGALGGMARALAAEPVFPALTGRVVDSANILSPQVETDLTAQLQALEDQTTRQLVVVTIPSLNGQPIEDYGYQLGRRRGVGQKSENNGALFIVAPADRQVRIEVGYGLEPVLTDALSSTILQAAVLPKFRSGDMQGGVVDGTRAIIQQLSLPDGEAKARVAAAQAQPAKGPSLVTLLVILFFVVVVFGRAFGGGRGGGVLPWIILGGLSGGRGGGGGGWGGGGGGGGGFSGGGGSFGGGGSSGSW